MGRRFTVSANYEDPIIDAAATGSDLIGRYSTGSRGTRFAYIESRAFHSSPPDTASYVIAGFIGARRGWPRGTRHRHSTTPFDRDSRLAFQFRRTFRRHRSLNPLPVVNRCNYASQLAATATAVNNVHHPRPHLHIHPFAFKILIEVCARGISIVNLKYLPGRLSFFSPRKLLSPSCVLTIWYAMMARLFFFKNYLLWLFLRREKWRLLDDTSII